MTTLSEYFETYALASLEKQEKLARLIGEHTADIDLETGTIRIGDSLTLPFQVLGTESHNTLTWLWAWADEQTELPAALMTSSFQLKTWGEQNGIPEFTLPSLDLNRADGRVISIIASSVCNAGCFYRDDYEGGALFLLLFGREIDQQPPFDAAGFLRQFSDLISLSVINHRNALVSYLRLKDIPFSERGAVMQFELQSGDRMSIEFDAQDAVKTMNGRTLPLD